MKQIRFYGVGNDVLSLLQLIESSVPLRYVTTGNYLQSEAELETQRADSAIDVPNLGVAGADSSVACDSFLVVKQGIQVNLRTVGASGERRCVDQLANPDSVLLTPGGIWRNTLVIEGRVATVSDSEASLGLMKQFQAATRHLFTKVGSCYVGPEAFTLLREGKRLTAAEHSPATCDLILPKPHIS